MKDVTAEEVRAAVLASGKTWIDHHDCGACYSMVGYSVEGGELYFNPGCDCSWSPPEWRSWQDAADWINMQTRSDIKAKIAARFGIAGSSSGSEEEHRG